MRGGALPRAAPASKTFRKMLDGCGARHRGAGATPPATSSGRADVLLAAHVFFRDGVADQHHRSGWHGRRSDPDVRFGRECRACTRTPAPSADRSTRVEPGRLATRSPTWSTGNIVATVATTRLRRVGRLVSKSGFGPRPAMSPRSVNDGCKSGQHGPPGPVPWVRAAVAAQLDERDDPGADGSSRCGQGAEPDGDGLGSRVGVGHDAVAEIA